MTSAISDRYVWVEHIRRFEIGHEPGPAHLTKCGIVMRGSGHTITKTQAKQLMLQPCRMGCDGPRQLPTAKYREK